MMPSLHARSRRRSTLVVAILLLTLALSVALTYQAVDAARSHREIAERTLRDHAGVAAWNFSLHVKETLHPVLTTAFQPIDKIDLSDPTTPLPPPDVIAPTTRAAARCEVEAQDASRYYFRLDLRDGSLVTSGAPVPASVRGWIARVVPAHVGSIPETNWIYTHLYGVAGDRHRSLALTVKRDGAGRPRAVYGFESCMSAWGHGIFRTVMERGELLAPPLTAGLPNDSLLSVVVTDGLGRVLYASPRQYPRSYSASFRLGGGYGGVVTHVSLSPVAANLLTPGGLPRSRMGFLLGLLALTAGLTGLAILQLRRESELARLRSDFVSSVSHELRTPLAQIRMFAETLLLNRVRSEEERRRSLEIIDQEARRLTHLVGNVLQFSRAERRASQLAPQPSDLADEVRGALEAFEPLAQARRVRLVPLLEPGVTVAVDRFALRQVLINLLDNAVKYGPVGQTVEVSLERQGGRAVVAVSDQGPGIAPRDRQRIWEPFVRRDRDANSAVAGSGIGLAVVRDLVARHGGTVRVEGTRAGGARFVIELPGAHAAPRTPEPTSPELERTTV